MTESASTLLGLTGVFQNRCCCLLEGYSLKEVVFGGVYDKCDRAIAVTKLNLDSIWLLNDNNLKLWCVYIVPGNQVTAMI